MLLKHLSQSVLGTCEKADTRALGGNQLGSYLTERLTHKDGGTVQHLTAANDTEEEEEEKKYCCAGFDLLA